MCAPQLATKTFHDTMFSIRHTSDPMWRATRKTLAQAFSPEAIRSDPEAISQLKMCAVVSCCMNTLGASCTLHDSCSSLKHSTTPPSSAGARCRLWSRGVLAYPKSCSSTVHPARLRCTSLTLCHRCCCHTRLELALLLFTRGPPQYLVPQGHSHALPCWHGFILLSAFMQVQDAMARITLDVIMATGFDLPSNAVDLDKACPLLEGMHFLMAETFR